MRTFFGVVIAVAAFAATAQVPVERVAADALVIDRVAEMSDRDLPADLLRRLVEQDIELLRGRRPDGSYEYASWERFEAGRVDREVSIRPDEDEMETIELRGENIYRVIVEVANRRMVIRRNRPVWLERVDVEYVAAGSTLSRQESFEVKAWLQPGEVRSIELPAIARQATVKAIVTAEQGGYANVGVALIEARIVDAASSPYASAVNAAKSALRAIEGRDVTALRSAARRMGDGVGGSSSSTLSVVAPPPVPVRPSIASPTSRQSGDVASRVELQAELQLIEDLLTGNESERRDGMDRLHQLIRQLRP